MKKNNFNYHLPLSHLEASPHCYYHSCRDQHQELQVQHHPYLVASNLSHSYQQEVIVKSNHVEEMLPHYLCYQIDLQQRGPILLNQQLPVNQCNNYIDMLIKIYAI